MMCSTNSKVGNASTSTKDQLTEQAEANDPHPFSNMLQCFP